MPNPPSPKTQEELLLSCSFCGGSATLFFQLDDIGDYLVKCNNCGASTCPNGIRYSKKEAISDWNTRAPIQFPEPAKELEEIVDALFAGLFMANYDCQKDVVHKALIRKAILESTQDLRRQVEELEKYVQHGDFCPKIPFNALDKSEICTCGLDKVLNQKG